MANFAERLAIFIEANGDKAIAEFKKVGDAAKKAGTDADGGAKGLGRFGIAGQTAGNLLKKGVAQIGITAAAAALVKFASDGVSAFLDVTSEIRKFQRVTGAAAEDASKFVAVFHALGIEPDVASSAIFKLSSRIGANNKQLAESGIIIAKNKSGNVDLVGTILNIGDAYKATEDQTKKADLVVAAFGSKQGQTLLPLLGKTRSEIEAIIKTAEGRGLIFDQAEIDKAKEFSVATRELGQAFKALQIDTGQGLVPALTDVALGITKVIDASHGQIGTALQSLFSILGGPAAPVIAALRALGAGEGEAARGATEAADAIAEETTKIDELKKAVFGATDAQHSFELAERGVATAKLGLTKATTDYNKLLKEGAVDEEKVADARQSLAAATRSLGSAHRAQRKAQEEYNDALAAAKLLGTDTNNDKLADAADNLADADDGVTSALERQADAAADLAKAKAGDPDYQQKLADAKQNVADATAGIKDAEYNLGKQSYENVAAHDAETLAIAAKADQAGRLRGELEAMLKLNPEQFAFLAPIIAALGGAGGAGASPGGAPALLAGGGLLPGVSGSGTPGGPLYSQWAGWSPTPTPAAAPVTTTNNVTVNATTSEADARLIAKEVMWNLN